MSKPAGWVKLHRAITENWIWSSEKHNKQSAWLDLIMMVNHEDRKIAIGNKVVIIKKGQVWTSYEKLRQRWKWSNDKLRGFITALVNDKMIAVQPTKIGTLITVLNYKKYQGSSGYDEYEPVNESENQSENIPESKSESRSVTNKNDTRMSKNSKKGTAGAPPKYES